MRGSAFIPPHKYLYLFWTLDTVYKDPSILLGTLLVWYTPFNRRAVRALLTVRAS